MRVVSGRGQEERAPVRELRPRLDEDAEHGRVDEGDLAEVDDEALGPVGRGLQQGGAHLRGVVQVELAGQADDRRRAAPLDPCHRLLVQARPVRHVAGEHTPVAAAGH